MSPLEAMLALSSSPLPHAGVNILSSTNDDGEGPASVRVTEFLRWEESLS